VSGVLGATRWALGSLLFIMGAKLALHRELIGRDLGALVSAVLSTLFLVAMFFLAFYLWGLRHRRPGGTAGSAPAENEARGPGELKAVLVNAAWILGGFLVFLVLPARAAAAVPAEALAEALLCALLFCIGFDLGVEVDKLHFKDLGPRLMLVPLVNIAGTLLSGCAFAFLRHLPVREGMLIFSGMGWYSLSSVLISGRGLLVLGLLAFIHNVFRELLAILLSPWAARISPYLPVYLGGATSMDVMLPFVQRYSGREYTLVSFYSGVVCSLAVIPLVNLLLAFR
jgi:uncharacterized membrane protein YbjE (DUF340 family)